MFFKNILILSLCAIIDLMIWHTYAYPALSFVAALYAIQLIKKKTEIINALSYIFIASSAGISLLKIILSLVASAYLIYIFSRWIINSYSRDAFLFTLIYLIIWQIHISTFNLSLFSKPYIITYIFALISMWN